MRIAEAANGREALAFLRDRRAESPDVVICDLYMDEMSGTEFLHKLRRDHSLPAKDVPVIVLTGETDDLVLAVARQVGATAIMTKPVSARELGSEIEAAVGFKLNASGFMAEPIHMSQWKLAPQFTNDTVDEETAPEALNECTAAAS